MKSEKQRFNEDSKAQIEDIEKRIKQTIAEIKALQSSPLAPDEVQVLRKLKEATNIWGYDVVEKNEVGLAFKRRELEGLQRLIIKIKERMIK